MTGASRGIGKGLALGLAAAGAAVACAARTEVPLAGGLPGTIGATAEAITRAGGRAIAIRCDIGDEEDIKRLVEQTVHEFGRLDVLVNNAMAPTRGRFDESSVAMWDESMRINVRSLYVGCQAALPHLQAAGGGSIINISSGGAEHSSNPYLPPGFIFYAVAKAAMERFSTVIAGELAEHNVAINALRPGAVRTELAEHELGPDQDWTGWATPDAVVPAVLHLAVQRGDGITGRVVDSTQFGRTWP
ncbi:MAG: short-chain dehydrogenase [Acidimicrobiales bacterium]|nr:short-chain dehydrogenase [Acidimicrobiales bacterium]